MNSRGVQYILYNITSLNAGWRNPNHIDILVSINANSVMAIRFNLYLNRFAFIQ